MEVSKAIVNEKALVDTHPFLIGKYKNNPVKDVEFFKPMNELLTKTLKEVIDESPDNSPHFLTIHRIGEAFPDE